MARWSRTAATLLWVSAACSMTCTGSRSADSGGPTDPSMILKSLEIKPINDILLVDLNTEGTKPFTARAYFADGSSADYTHKVQWTLDNPAVGHFVGATFHSAQLGSNKVDFTRVLAQARTSAGAVHGVANLTVVWLRQSGNSQDFFFELPYQAPSQTKPLTFSTQVQSLDLFILEDTTGSMGPEIDNLVRSMMSTIIPGVKAAAAKDAWFGVGSHDDFPAMGYGNANCNGPHDEPFILIQPMTSDVKSAEMATLQLQRGGAGTAGCGGDLPEGQLEGLYQVATGEGNQVPGVVDIAPHHKGIGGVEFRDGALPVITLITDAVFHTKGETMYSCFGSPTDYAGAVATAAHDRQQVTDALNKICAKVVGISCQRTDVAEECLPNRDLDYFANSTGAVVPPEAWDVGMRPDQCPMGQCCTGIGGKGQAPDANGLCALNFKIPQDGSSIGDQVTTGITNLARFASFDVVTDVLGQTMGEHGEMLPAGKTTADFIQSIVPLDALPPPPPPNIPTPIITDKGFSKVVPGSFVRFNIQAVNNLIKEGGMPQVFHATIRIRAGGCADLDQRDVIILIPPAAPVLG